MKLGNKLYWLTQVYTLAVVGLFARDFMAQGKAPVDNNLVVLYFAFLSAYAADKEVGRWASRKDVRQAQPERKGSWFVIFWGLAFLVVEGTHIAYPEWVIPEGLSRVVLGVLGIFFGTGISKRFYSMLQPEGAAWGQDLADLKAARSEGQKEKAGREGLHQMEQEAIMKLLKANPQGLAVSEIARGASLHPKTAWRHLAEMTEKGLLISKGKARATRYYLAGK